MPASVVIGITRGGDELSSARIDHLGRAYRRLDRSGRLLRVIDLGSVRFARLLDGRWLAAQSRRFTQLRCSIVGSGLI